MRNERYYYSIMSSEEKKAYKMIFEGLKMRAFNIVVSLYLTLEEVQEVYIKVLYDNPLFYYINQTVIRMQGNPGYWILLPEYLYTNNEINRINVEIRQDANFDEESYHAWNLVKIGDESYHVDVTWDNLYDEDFRHISYDYFNLTTKDILLDHQPMDELPICEATRLNYFYSTGSFVSTYEELVKFIEERIEAKEIAFKASKDKGFFLKSEELKDKTVVALSCYSMKCITLER